SEYPLPLETVLTILRQLWNRERARPSHPSICIDERILCGEPLIAPYRFFFSTAIRLEPFRNAFSNLRKILIDSLPRDKRGLTKANCHHSQLNGIQLLFSTAAVSQNNSDTSDGFWPPVEENTDDTVPRLDYWYLRVPFTA